MACSHNLASNRQTRMLADLSLVGCYNSSLSNAEKDRIMLASAKHNLQFMPFFMLTEYQKVSCPYNLCLKSFNPRQQLG